MTNKFISMERLQSLYCIWIETGNPRRPLECLWIDLEIRSFQASSFAYSESIPAVAGETEVERTKCVRKKPSPARGMEIVRARRGAFGPVNRKVGSLTRILIALAVLLTVAWAAESPGWLPTRAPLVSRGSPCPIAQLKATADRKMRNGTVRAPAGSNQRLPVCRAA
jgi:hypothetical protein